MKKIIKDLIESPAVALEKTVESSERAARAVIDQQPMKKAQQFWRLLGPGLTTGAADDDPAGIATYSQAGAQSGFQLLWLALFTFPLMAVVQEMCARIGLVTGRGLAANIRHHYPRSILYLITGLLFLANSFNIGADLGAMAKVSQLVLPQLTFAHLVLFFAVVSLALQIFTTYERYARYLKYLALILFAYVITAFFLPNLDWLAIGRAVVVPSFQFTRDQILIVVAVLGTTISPYLFFWQTSQEVEEQILEGKTTIAQRAAVTTDQEINNMRVDVWSGMFLSNLIMGFIILTAGATLFSHGLTQIASAADAAQALKPFVGEGAYLLFALGVIGTGMLAIPTLAGSVSYALSESLGWKYGLYRRLKEAYAFYGVIIISMAVGLGLNFIGLDPIKALIYSSIANALVAPLILVPIVQLSGSSKVMGRRRNGWPARMVGWAIVGLMVVAGLATLAALITG